MMCEPVSRANSAGPCRVSMVVAAYSGKIMSKQGLGYHIVESMKGQHWRLAASLLILAVTAFILVEMTSILVFAGVIVFAFAFSFYTKRSFGGTTGDMFGAANEIGRAIALLILLTVEIV